MGQAVAVEFSVIIPTHNRPDALRRAVESVCRQSFADFELIVVDDGCDEPVSQVLGALMDPRVTVLRQDRAGGVSSARNAGIARARGRLVCFLDDDDLFHRDYLARVREAFAEPSAGLPGWHRRSSSGKARRRNGSRRDSCARFGP
jgi:glycosyltransferase involved in cell wall biosynthesis